MNIWICLPLKLYFTKKKLLHITMYINHSFKIYTENEKGTEGVILNGGWCKYFQCEEDCWRKQLIWVFFVFVVFLCACELCTVPVTQRLYRLGARMMVVNGLGPLGCIPSQRVKSRSGQCLKRVNKWVVEFNSKLQKLISSLNSRLPNAALVFADTYPAVFQLIANPTAYGTYNHIYLI